MLGCEVQCGVVMWMRIKSSCGVEGLSKLSCLYVNRDGRWRLWEEEDGVPGWDDHTGEAVHWPEGTVSSLTCFTLKAALTSGIHWDIPSDMDRGSWSILASITGQYHGFVLLPSGSLYKVLVLKWCSSMLWGCESRGLYYKISSTYPRSHLPVCPNIEVCGARSGNYPSCYREGETWA